MTLLSVAKTYYDAGLNVLPADRTQKRPIGSWKKFTESRPEFDVAFPRNGKPFDALCVVCGSTSGGLEIIDFDLNGRFYPPYRDKVGEGLEGLVVETTQSGGFHIAFRSGSFGRNQKLASVQDGCAIETRGEGGICLIAPTDGYELLHGCWSRVPTISDDERSRLFQIAKDFDENPVVNKQPQKATPPPTVPSSKPFPGESAADYLRRDLGPLRDSLRRAGWTFLWADSKHEYYSRPKQPVQGKVGGSLDLEDRFFYCFSSSAPPLEPSKAHSPLEVIAALDFSGSISDASKTFAKYRPTVKKIRVANFYNDEDDNFRSFRQQNQEHKKPDEAIEFPPDLLNIGGLIGEFADLANQFAIRAQPEGAFLAGLACQSFLAGRAFCLNYAGTLVTPNLYTLFLAPSGMGKEVLRRVCSGVATTYRPTEAVPENFASVQALQNMTGRVSKIFWLHDEFGRDLAVMAGRQTNVNISGVITESLKLYSNANNRSYLPKLIASEAKGTKRPEPVDRPSLTIFATGNPTEFYEATNEAVMRNGYVSRFTIVYGRTYSEKRKTSFDEAKNAEPMRLSSHLSSRVKQYRDVEGTAVDPYVLTFDEDAFDCITAYDEETEKQIRLDVFNSDGVTEMKARLFEKVWKYALLFSLSTYGPRPTVVVDRHSAELAVQLVDYESRQFAKNAQRFAASAVSALANEILEFIRSSDGNASRAQITRKFQRRDKRQRDEAIATLVEADYVEEFSQSGKTSYFITSTETKD